MLWGVGTGRCGTKSLADQMGGLHEPEPSIKEEALERMSSGAIMPTLIDKIINRSKLDVPIISDNKQSFVIDLIADYDKDAKFIWLLRDPLSTSISLASRGEWGSILRYQPKLEEFDELPLIRKCAMYWLHKNLLIEKSLCGLKYDVIFTDRLDVRSNVALTNLIEPHQTDVSWIENNMLGQWKDWIKRYDA